MVSHCAFRAGPDVVVPNFTVKKGKENLRVVTSVEAGNDVGAHWVLRITQHAPESRCSASGFGVPNAFSSAAEQAAV